MLQEGKRQPTGTCVSVIFSVSRSWTSFRIVQNADLDEHEPLHGLVPLQQHDPRLESSTQILVARVRVSHCDTDEWGQIQEKTGFKMIDG